MDTTTSFAARQGYRLRNLRDIWVEVAVDFDREGPVDVVTDLDALSAVLAEIAAGGGFALRLRCEGGPCADARLVVEDCALELGAALAAAMGAGATRIVLPAPPSPGRLPGGLDAVLVDSLARALGARAGEDAAAAGYAAIGRALRTGLARA